ncbi:hypothetical protein COW46_01040 [Candidatus Gracilibacteria bacterium CG17_big_fil_post_rev_8_21_14_2_50_48_13]|nr:MAG: hypothetical protein COW46_01040 [Candidatus Gracilibacteria bacterium CG17_big_fil_post_rev_8_21_14_2_50_48_13]
MRDGFSLIEILLSVALLALVAGVSIPVSFSWVASVDQRQAVRILTTSLEEARTYARANKNDGDWGVQVENGSVIVFQGANYASRVVGEDRSWSLPGGVDVTGASGVVFAKVTGIPSSYPVFTLTKGSNVSTVTVGALGTVTPY